MATTQPSFDPQTVQVTWNIIQGMGTLVLGGITATIAYFNIRLSIENAKLTARGVAVTEKKSRLEEY